MPSEENRDTAETFRRTRGTVPNGGGAPGCSGRPPKRANGSASVRTTAPKKGSCAARKANGRANGSANHAASAEGTLRVARRADGRDPAFPVRISLAGSSSPPPAARASGAVRTPVCGNTPALAGKPDAASDDASGHSVAMDVAFPATPGAARDAYAAAAEGANGNPRSSSTLCTRDEPSRVPSENSPDGQPEAPLQSPEKSEIAGADAPLPGTPSEFAEEIHRQVSLIEVWKGLLTSDDDKIRQRAAEKLTEMRYKGAAAMEEERTQIVIDLDSAVARRAARAKSGGIDE